MSLRRILLSLLALSVVVGLLPATEALAARNKAPRIVKALMKDKDGDGKADRVVLTYNEKIKHKLDTSRFPFRVQGYKIKKINAARGSLRLVIMLRENANAPAKPSSIKYTRTRKQPVLDLKKLQAQKQLLTKNIIGLAVTPPPPPPTDKHTLTVLSPGDGEGVVTSSPSGIDCGSTCTADFTDGAQVTLTATPDEASKATFGGWEGCASTTNTCTLTMDSDKTVSATFSKAGEFALQVTKDGTGAGVVTSTSTPTQTSQINCGATCTATFPDKTVVTLKAVPDATTKATIAGWSGGGCSGTGETCNVLMDKAQQVKVTFNKPVEYTLAVNNSGGTGAGTVTSSDGKINCGSVCSAKVPKDSVVTLTVAPASGSVFAGWGGAATCPVTSTSCQVTVSSEPTTVTTVFNLATTVMHKLTVTKTGVGSISSNPAGLTCTEVDLLPCEASFPAGTTVVLTADPGNGLKIKQWTGCTPVGDTTCEVTMDAAKDVGIEFELDTALPESPLPNVQP